MTITHVSGANVAGATSRSFDHRQHAVGQRVQFIVLRQTDRGRYLVAFDDQQRFVSSTVSLTVGSTVRGIVTAVGEKLELRYVGADVVTETMQDHEAADEDALDALAAQCSVELETGEQQVIREAMKMAVDPAAAAASGIFLGKLHLPVDAASLQALYRAQSWQNDVMATATAIDLPGSEPAARAALSEQMLAALQADGSDARGEDDARRHPAERLLNEQDESSVAYRFGVLPVLIDGQLTELDLVHFRERRSTQRTPGMRRLVMTFSTPTLGRIEVAAQALDERLAISITADSVQAQDALAARANEIRELVARLGWNVESVSCDFDTRVARAARHVIEHVLKGDTLSRLV